MLKYWTIYPYLVWLPVGGGLEPLDVLLSLELDVVPPLGDKGGVPLDVAIGARASGRLQPDTVVHSPRLYPGNF